MISKGQPPRAGKPGGRRSTAAAWVALGAVVSMAGGLYLATGRAPAPSQVLAPLPDGVGRHAGLGDTFKVVTWNLHYGAGAEVGIGPAPTRDRVEVNLDAVAARIRSWDADIVALQEVDRPSTRSHGVDQLARLRTATGLPFAAWCETWNAGWVPYPGLDPRRQIGRVVSGQAVLSRFPLIRATGHLLPQPTSRARVVTWFSLRRSLLDVAVDLGEGRTLRVINAHLESVDARNRATQAAQTASLLAETERDVVLLGDMNSVPTRATQRKGWVDEPDADLSDDDTIARLSVVRGLDEVVPESVYLADESAWFTYPATAPNRRLDYLFFGAGLKRVRVEVIRMSAPPSDHLPLVATFMLVP